MLSEKWVLSGFHAHSQIRGILAGGILEGFQLPLRQLFWVSWYQIHWLIPWNKPDLLINNFEVELCRQFIINIVKHGRFRYNIGWWLIPSKIQNVLTFFYDNVTGCWGGLGGGGVKFRCFLWFVKTVILVLVNFNVRCPLWQYSASLSNKWCRPLFVFDKKIRYTWGKWYVCKSPNIYAAFIWKALLYVVNIRTASSVGPVL